MFNFSKVLSIWVITFLLVLISVAAIPGLPLIVDGSITINGAKAPIGTIITAKIDDQTRTEFMVKIEGRFAFVVEGNETDEGKVVSFFVGDDKAEQTTTWSSGKVEKIDITIGQASEEDNEEETPQTDTNSGSGSGGGSSITKTVVETKEEQETETELEKDKEDSEKGLEETAEETTEELVNEEEITLDEEKSKPLVGVLTIVAILVIGLIVYFIIIKK